MVWLQTNDVVAKMQTSVHQMHLSFLSLCTCIHILIFIMVILDVSFRCSFAFAVVLSVFFCISLPNLFIFQICLMTVFSLQVTFIVQHEQNEIAMQHNATIFYQIQTFDISYSVLELAYRQICKHRHVVIGFVCDENVVEVCIIMYSIGMMVIYSK